MATDDGMKSFSGIAEKILDLVEQNEIGLDKEEPCPDCFNTGTQLLVIEGQTVSRPCRHI